MKKGAYIVIVLLLCGIIAHMIVENQNEQRQKQEAIEQVAQASQQYLIRIIQIEREMEQLKKEISYQGKRPYIIRAFTAYTPEELQIAAELAEAFQFPLVIAIDANQPPESLQPMLDRLDQMDCEFVITGSPVSKEGLDFADQIRQRMPDQDGMCYLLRGGDAMGKVIESVAERGYSTITLIRGVTTGWMENNVNYMEYTYYEEDSELHSPERTVKVETAQKANSMLLICFDLGAWSRGKLTVPGLESYFTAYNAEFCTGIKEAVQAIEEQKKGYSYAGNEKALKLEALQAELDALNEALKH